MDYLKLFQTHEEYEAFVSGGTMVRPNVSHCVSENEVHYNPWVETRVVAKYNVTDTSGPTKIGYNEYISGFSEIEIDGVIQPSVVSAYTFDTLGEHIVKYTLTDQTKINGAAFYDCSNLISVIIPNKVTSIDSSALNRCSSLTSVIIPDSVTSIGVWAFYYCI